MLTSAKPLFSIPDDVTFLNCANMAPQLRAVSAAGTQAVASKEHPWTLPAADWFANAEILRGLAAKLLGATPEDMALIPATSYGLAIAAHNVPVRRGQTIVLLDQEYPSNVYVWRELAQQHDLTILTVTRDARTWTESIVAAIDTRTAVVSVPNCHWTDGSIVDLVQVGQKARQVGASLVIDASQSLGAYPLDVQAVQPDFVVSVGYKWLLGPYALGYLYASARWQQGGRPIENSWLNRRGSEDFTKLVEYEPAYKAGARRFDVGEFPNFVLLPMALAALEQVLAWQIPAIQQAIGALLLPLSEGVSALGYRVAPPTERVGHLLGIRAPRPFDQALSKRLAAEKIFVSFRGDSIRVAPHLYNTPGDISRLLNVLAETRNF